jgi:predicted phosphohydrolase
MKIYALGDLHLSFSSNPDPPYWTADQHKPMSDLDLFWQDHSRKIYENWLKLVGPEDVVLVPGDISWAMRLEDVQADIAYLGLLPGNIILIQGNHDYWWQSISRVRKLLPANIKAIQNDCVLVDNMAICGARGWSIPGSVCFEESRDMKIYLREINRLENSLKCAASQKAEKIIVMMHFMPCNEKRELSGFIELFIKYQVETVVYGHLHSKGCRCRLPEKLWGINFFLTSADYLGFTPVLIDSY